MSNGLINWEKHIVYLSKVKNIKYGEETLKQIKYMQKKKGKNHG